VSLYRARPQPSCRAQAQMPSSAACRCCPGGICSALAFRLRAGSGAEGSPRPSGEGLETEFQAVEQGLETGVEGTLVDFGLAPGEQVGLAKVRVVAALVDGRVFGEATGEGTQGRAGDEVAHEGADPGGLAAWPAGVDQARLKRKKKEKKANTQEKMKNRKNIKSEKKKNQNKN